jgi:membrane protease YdiL (CAAX protease family)
MQVSLAQSCPSRFGVIVIFFLTVALYYLVGFLGTLAVALGMWPFPVLSKWVILICELILPAPAYLYLRHRGYNPRLLFRLNPVSGRIAALSVALGFALFVIAHEIDRLIAIVLPFPEELQSGLLTVLGANNWQEWIVVILAVVVFAGIFEEMLFRGFVQKSFEQRHEALHAILITTFLFAAIHGLLWWFVQIFILSVFLGWMAWKSESIIPGAIVHAINNLFAVLLINLEVEPQWLFWQSAESTLGEGHVHPFYLLSAIAVICFGFRLFNRFCEEETEIPTLLNTPI